MSLSEHAGQPAPSRTVPEDRQTSCAPLRPDAELLAEVACGELDAMRQLAERHQPAMLGVARALLTGGSIDTRQGAMDAVQNAWIRVIDRAGQFRSEGDAAAWLTRIVVNECRQLRRTERRLKHRESNAVRQQPVTEETPMFSEAVRDAVAALPEHQREVIVLCHGQGLSREQAAEAIGVPTGTIKSRLFKAMTTLRDLLREAAEAKTDQEAVRA